MLQFFLSCPSNSSNSMTKRIFLKFSPLPSHIQSFFVQGKSYRITAFKSIDSALAEGLSTISLIWYDSFDRMNYKRNEKEILKLLGPYRKQIWKKKMKTQTITSPLNWFMPNPSLLLYTLIATKNMISLLFTITLRYLIELTWIELISFFLN